ncbi:MAG: DNA-processing protein DprA [Polyangiaceae bacterium]
MTLLELTPLHPAYPSRLRAMARPPASLFTQGGSLEAARVVAIVGSRAATPDAKAYAVELAGRLCGHGVVVVSGGALGIDTAAHEGALKAGGRTLVVAPTGPGHVFPDDNADLFATVARGPGAMLWPFPGALHPPSGFLIRNHILVGLADAVVVVQAGARSGALHASSCARKLGRPLWVCPAQPWSEAFAGSRELLEGAPRTGARPLHSTDALVAALGLPSRPAVATPPNVSLSPSEADVLRVTSATPLHVDAIASGAGVSAATAAVALLTLALENVVVEGPPGLFRRRDGR